MLTKQRPRPWPDDTCQHNDGCARLEYPGARGLNPRARLRMTRAGLVIAL